MEITREIDLSCEECSRPLTAEVVSKPNELTVRIAVKACDHCLESERQIAKREGRDEAEAAE